MKNESRIAHARERHRWKIIPVPRNRATRDPAMPVPHRGFDNQTEAACTDWTSRLYVTGLDGEVVFKSAPGPFGFTQRTWKRR